MDFQIRQNNALIELNGVCDYTCAKSMLHALKTAILNPSTRMIDFSSVTRVDFVFCAFVLDSLEERLKHNRAELIQLSGTNTQINEIFSTLLGAYPFEFNPLKEFLAQENIHQKSVQEVDSQNSESRGFMPLKSFFYHCGLYVVKRILGVLDFLNFCGACLWYFIRSLTQPKFLKIKSIFYHMNQSGFKALPVALLTAFIVSYAIALQGVLQLDKMGVPIMSVEIVAKLSLREMGPFILAIVIAGRSSSAFSAQLGVMNLTEESDALKTMNLSVFDYLVLPRVLALVLVMPLLVFLADVVSLFAAMLAVKAETGITFSEYLERFYEYVGINNFWVGIAKAPFFGAAVALVGCFRGLYVRGDTESVGLETTKSVVNAIFWVILINAIFSVITTRLNI